MMNKDISANLKQKYLILGRKILLQVLYSMHLVAQESITKTEGNQYHSFIHTLQLFQDIFTVTIARNLASLLCYASSVLAHWYHSF